jgi:ATP-binding cassette subfamily F protein uup
MVLKAHHVSFSYDDEHPILHDIDIDLGPGDRVGIVGPNGSGKSTFVNLLAHRIEPTSGTVKRGPTVVTAYLDQQGSDFNLEATVQELVAGPQGIPGSPADVALMKRFWFTGALPTTRAGDLSGGERRRLQLLLALSVRPNVLFLDEPTNDLDLETIRLIEEFLSQWPGTLIVVSHDRTFLSRTTDRLLEVHADGTIADVPGGIDAWIARAAGVVTSPQANGENEGALGEPATTTSVSRGRLIRDAEKEMSRLDRRRVALTNKIMACADHVEQTRLGAELAVVQQSLDTAEEHWLTLSQ